VVLVETGAVAVVAVALPPMALILGLVERVLLDWSS
jgi:hypothetical protein